MRGSGKNNLIPLIVDWDHTLIDTDLLVESSIATLKKSPWLVALYPFWLLKLTEKPLVLVMQR
jgi:hypothetical protein